jgi:hypothetical protein
MAWYRYVISTEHFRGVQSLLEHSCIVTATNLQTQVGTRFTNTAVTFGQAIMEVDLSGDADTAVYFFCPTLGVADDPFKATSNAITEDILSGSSHNHIALCPPFFSPGVNPTLPLATDQASYNQAKLTTRVENEFRSPCGKDMCSYCSN